MSCITLDEILVLCASEFGVATRDIGRCISPLSTSHRSRSPLAEARVCYLYLARRHTLCAWPEIFWVLRDGMNDRECSEMKKEVKNFERRLRSGFQLANRVELIEQQIDDIHDERIASLGVRLEAAE